MPGRASPGHTPEEQMAMPRTTTPAHAQAGAGKALNLDGVMKERPLITKMTGSCNYPVHVHIPAASGHLPRAANSSL